MSAFLTENLLLDTAPARVLYHEYAATMPIIDYHNHLSPQLIAQNNAFANITQLWLNGDHYKWRAMRSYGVAEKYITGEASDQDKFLKWAEVVPYTIRNPLFHWTHLELKNPFGIEAILDKNSAADIYAQCNNKLAQPEFKPQALLQRFNVQTLCTTDDPADDLQWHKLIANSDAAVKVLPTFRPDRSIHIEQEGTKQYLQQLSASSGIEITDFDTLLQALTQRANYFDQHQCKLADHALTQVPTGNYDVEHAEKTFQLVLNNGKPTTGALNNYKLVLLLELGKIYHRLGWVQQFHVGALRNANTRLYNHLGLDSGFDAIDDLPQIQGLAGLLNQMDLTDKLPKTIIYNLNSSDNDAFAALAACFNDGSTKGKIQYGAAWWFNDQLDGLEKQLNSLSNMGLLSCFIGMLTDSRSFLSYSRHEYFRRILCGLLGREIEKGLLPNDTKWIGQIVQDVCFFNAKNYFRF